MKGIICTTLLITVLFACNDDKLPAGDPKFLTATDKENKEEINENTTSKKQVNDEDNTSNTQLLNDISLSTQGGVEVSRAFLSYANGNLVPPSNTTSLGRPVFLNLNIAKGWQETDGKVSIGASEKISTDNGTVILEEADLFKDYTSFNADDAKFIQMKALVNSMYGPIEYFVVDYRVWDKNGDGSVKGHYKFYIE
jgi:hypothetical protein